MFSRLCKPLLSNSFFVFGARATGKSTLVRSLLGSEKTWTIDLLNAEQEDHFSRQPQALEIEALARAADIDWIFIDEVQKIPKLLDIVHSLTENIKTKHLRFALSGSSARKLKLAGANLLAGRAFVNELFPLSFLEMGDQFDLDLSLNWGSLPKVTTLHTDVERAELLRAYTRTYLKEEIWDERLIHNLDPFRKFLEIAAQTNGTILNYSKLSRHTGVDDKTIKKYFEILADTFIGFYLESYHRSVRKQQISSPKFFLFDPGVKRAMEGMLTVPIVPKTFSYGRAFEHYILAECVRLNSYFRRDFKLSYLKTKDDLEIDLIIERPGKPILVIEIKSTDEVTPEDSVVLQRFVDDFPDAEFRIWSNDKRPKIFADKIRAVYWQDGIREGYFL
jgi:predicted AAA+ superfamily ATPase